jgi:hypothetical protein
MEADTELRLTLYTPKQAGEILQLGERAVIDRVRKGEIAGHAISKRDWRISKFAILEYLRLKENHEMQACSRSPIRRTARRQAA